MPFETFLRLPEDKKNMIIRHGLMEFSVKNYQDANTDVIIKACGISKGSLYHYFGNKKSFYLFLLSHSLMVFENMNKGNFTEAGTFYDVLFEDLDLKLSMYQTHPLEIAFLTITAREQCGEVSPDKDKLLRASMERARQKYLSTLKAAIFHLALKKSADPIMVLKGLTLYIDAIRTGYLEQYHDKPYAFFENKELVKQEIKSYVDLLLHGVLKEEAK